MGEELRPVVSPKRPRKKPPRLHILTRCVRDISLLAALLGIGASLWFFWGFAENDHGAWHLLNAAALSFGGGGLFFVPALFIAMLAHTSLKHSQFPKLLPLILILPWVPIIWRLFQLGGPWMALGAFIALYTTLVLVWVFSIWIRKSPR